MMQILVPELGENIESADVLSISVKAGDHLEVGQALIEVETEKAAVEIPSEVAGVVLEVHVSVGQSIKDGDPIISIDPVEASAPVQSEPKAEEAPVQVLPAEAKPVSSEEAPQHHAPTSPAPEHHPSKLVAAAPSVRRFAREIGVEISDVSGSGPGGRLTKDDVKEHAKNLLANMPATTESAPDLPDFSRWGSISAEPASKIRRVTAQRLSRAWRIAPQVTNHETADITHLDELRKRFKQRVSAAGGRLTMTAILVKVCAVALKQFPDLNSSFDPSRNSIIRKHYVHVGVAVDTEHGLLVPVIRNADQKSITAISRELDELAERARHRKLKLDEMEGATFTISNLGGIGGTGFSPIVNWPEVAILGVSRGRIEATWIDDSFEPRLILPLSLSYDHRLIDGAMAARFLRWLSEALEEPLLLSLDG